MFENEHDRVHTLTNDIHNGKDVFYNNRCGLTHQSANGCCPHGSNFLCVTHFPKVNYLGKISMIRQKNQRLIFNPSSCVIVSQTHCEKN